MNMRKHFRTFWLLFSRIYLALGCVVILSYMAWWLMASSEQLKLLAILSWLHPIVSILVIMICKRWRISTAGFSTIALVSWILTGIYCGIVLMFIA